MTNNLEDYCIQKSYQENDLLKQIKEFTFDTELAPQMISGPLVCNALLMIIQIYVSFVQLRVFTMNL